MRTFRFRNPSSVLRQNSALALGASPASPSIYGQPVVFTAATGSNATGNVIFSTGGVPLATNALVGGVAAYTNSTFNAGTYSIQAVYPGDTIYLASTSSLSQVVAPAATTISYAGALFTYTGLPQSPAITVAGSNGARTTNYAGVGATSYSSSSPPINAGSYYVTNTVAASGNYLAASAGFAFLICPPPAFSNYTVMAGGRQLNLRGSGPPGQPWRLLRGTNLALPLAQWGVVASNIFTTNGQFNYTVLPLKDAANFYQLATP